MTRILKPARVAVALAVGGLLTAALVDFRGLVPPAWSHALASLQFVPSMWAGGACALAGVAVLVVTLLFGRVYCSVLCPLGILQDVVLRVRTWVAGPPKCWKKAEPAWLRHLILWGAVAALLAGWGGVVLAWLDPWSIFGRIVSMLFRPMLAAANNLLVGPAEAAGVTSLYRVDVPWAPAAVVGVTAGMLALVAALAAWRGRLYCNTVCPVGTLLGLIARHAAFRLRIDRADCIKCGVCLPGWKAGCVDLRTGEIDFGRCVGCFNCLDKCPHGAVRFRFMWRRAPGPAVAPLDPGRRALLASTGPLLLMAAAGGDGGGGLQHRRRQGGEGVGHAGASTPPGSGGVERLLEHCTACNLCISACPTGVLQPAFLEYGLAGMMKPRMDFNVSFCNHGCARCGEVCPDGAIRRLAVGEKQLVQTGVARFHEGRCVVRVDNTDCGACAEHCPTGAVFTVPYRGGLRIPRVNEALCTGCGACEYACPVRPVKAIIVQPLAVHRAAVKAAPKPPERPVPGGGGDFPF